MANELRIDQKTATHYADLLAQLYLAHQLPAWHSNLGQRQIKSPKAYIPDAGLLAYLTGTDEQRLTNDPSGNLAGMFFETFVAMELLRQSEWAEHEVQLYHYRDRAQREVDLVLERNSGDVIGVEAKAAATAAERDFRGLQFLRDKLGPRFKAGAVLYTATRRCHSATVSPRYPSRACGATRRDPFSLLIRHLPHVVLVLLRVPHLYFSE